MPGRHVWLIATLIAVSVSGCKLIDTGDDESVEGRGPGSFDPYAGPASGAIRLALQTFKGCAVLPTGEPFAKGGANIPYPEECQSPNFPGQTATAPMTLVVDTDYFLNQFTVMDAVTGVHGPDDENAVIEWFRSQSILRDLDWRNLGRFTESWLPNGSHPSAFNHQRLYGNASWMLKKDDTFTVELLDVDGNVRQSETYRRKDLFAENPKAGHTQVGWEHRNVGAPHYQGDPEPRPPKTLEPGFGAPQPPYTYTYARFDAVLSVSPDKRIRVDRTLAGDGAIRVTWSQLPNQPFYFPARFVRRDQLPRSCFVGGDVNQPVTCNFGVQPLATLSRPKNGKFYQPGERFQVQLAVLDGDGNYLHPKDHFPTWNEYIRNQANGLSYATLFHFDGMNERDSMTAAKVLGPLQDIGPYHEPGSAPYFQFPAKSELLLVEMASVAGAIAGSRNLKPPTTWTVTLPENAKPGTYAVVFKVHRFFLGERFSKTEVFHFPVGQEERTQLPGRVGNCQICHRGTLSLDNVRHGLNVDHIEVCRGCHNRDFPFARASGPERLVHEVHAYSNKFSVPMSDCTTCHLSRAATVRPSMNACIGCHPTIHGGQYDALLANTDLDAIGPYGNCASACHEKNLPKSHVYPAQ